MSQPPLFEGNAMEYYFAPMEGITGGEFRRVHHRHFFGVDKYYMPFISPTREHLFTQRERRNMDPEVNRGIPAVPQLLTKSAEDFLWAANALGEMGYEEVNLNLGCPSGTVVAKGKGAGMLAHPEELDRFLDQVFGGVRVKVSVKTRLGLESPEEFGDIRKIPPPSAHHSSPCAERFLFRACSDRGIFQGAGDVQRACVLQWRAGDGGGMLPFSGAIPPGGSGNDRTGAAG